MSWHSPLFRCKVAPTLPRNDSCHSSTSHSCSHSLHWDWWCPPVLLCTCAYSGTHRHCSPCSGGTVHRQGSLVWCVGGFACCTECIPQESTPSNLRVWSFWGESSPCAHQHWCIPPVLLPPLPVMITHTMITHTDYIFFSYSFLLLSPSSTFWNILLQPTLLWYDEHSSWDQYDIEWCSRFWRVLLPSTMTSLFGTIYYRLYGFKYKYPVVAILYSSLVFVYILSNLLWSSQLLSSLDFASSSETSVHWTTELPWFTETLSHAHAEHSGVNRLLT